VDLSWEIKSVPNGARLRCFDWVITLKTQEKLQMYGDEEHLN